MMSAVEPQFECIVYVGLYSSASPTLAACGMAGTWSSGAGRQGRRARGDVLGELAWRRGEDGNARRGDFCMCH